MRLPFKQGSCGIALVATLVVAAGEDAVAQDRAQDRSGRTGGLSLGGGALLFSGAADEPIVDLIRQGEDQRGGFSFDLRFGGFVNHRFALFAELDAIGTGEDVLEPSVGVRLGNTELQYTGGTTDVSVFVFGGTAQFWVMPRFWIRGGLGAGSLSRTLYLQDSVDLTIDKGYGLAVLGAVGAEIWRFAQGAVDLHVQFTTVSVEGLRVNAPTLRLGVSFW